MKPLLYRLLGASSLGCGPILDARAQGPAPAGPAWLQGGAGTLLVSAIALVALVLGVLLWRQQRRRASAEQALSATDARLRQLTALQDHVMENERRRIARDIHDDLGQNLLALKIDISLLQMNGADMHALIQQKLNLLARHVELSIESLRCIINDLRPAALQAGLREAIEWQLGEFSRINGISHALEAEPAVYALCAERHLDTILFRILQECLSNVARHAKASAVHVALCRHDGALQMTVRDNGVGMPPGPGRRGCGLFGIEERMTAIGGHLRIDSGPGRGTTLSLTIPLATSDCAALETCLPSRSETA